MMNVNPRISVEARTNIVSRINGGVSVVKAAAIGDANELAYAVRFLVDHFTYKRSKGQGSVNTGAGQQALQALQAAAETFAQEVMGATGPKPTVPPVSPMAEGKIGNPYDYTR